MKAFWAFVKPLLLAVWDAVRIVPPSWFLTAALCAAFFFAGCSCRAADRDPAAACACPGCGCQTGQPCPCGPACRCSFCPGKPPPAPCTLIVRGVEAVDFTVGGHPYRANGQARRLVTPALTDVGHYDFAAGPVRGSVTVVPGATVDVTVDVASGSLGSVVRPTPPPPLIQPLLGNCPDGRCPTPSAIGRWWR